MDKIEMTQEVLDRRLAATAVSNFNAARAKVSLHKEPYVQWFCDPRTGGWFPVANRADDAMIAGSAIGCALWLVGGSL